LRHMYHRLINCFGCTRWYSCVTRLKWKHVSVRLEIVLVSVQDRCTVCGNCNIASEIVLAAPDGTPR
jgi:Na+-translocating ferredoxin:NAD+ oxidoreductase RNF subunit RnfB